MLSVSNRIRVSIAIGRIRTGDGRSQIVGYAYEVLCTSSYIKHEFIKESPQARNFKLVVHFVLQNHKIIAFDEKVSEMEGSTESRLALDIHSITLNEITSHPGTDSSLPLSSLNFIRMSIEVMKVKITTTEIIGPERNHQLSNDNHESMKHVATTKH